MGGQVWQRFPKFGRKARQKVGCNRREYADGDGGGQRIRSAATDLLNVVQVSEDATRIVDNVTANRGDQHLLRSAFNQLGSQFLLQLLDLR